MDNDLEFLVHFFHDEEYLFKTITMAEVSQMEEICNKISSERGWYWPRFAESERHDYLQRRRFVEKALYEDYTQEYGSLKEKIPVFFYLYPSITKQKIIELGQHRMRHGEQEPHILIVKIQDIAVGEQWIMLRHQLLHDVGFHQLTKIPLQPRIFQTITANELFEIGRGCNTDIIACCAQSTSLLQTAAESAPAHNF